MKLDLNANCEGPTRVTDYGITEQQQRFSSCIQPETERKHRTRNSNYPRMASRLSKRDISTRYIGILAGGQNPHTIEDLEDGNYK